MADLSKVKEALEQARQLAEIASDWNLDEVEIDGQIVATYQLVKVFEEALTSLEEPAPPVDEAAIFRRNIRRGEALAEYAHEAWSGWMKHLFGKGEFQPKLMPGAEGTKTVWVMPPWAVERWTRQMETPYHDLPENEKDSDRKEAARMIAIYETYDDPLWLQMGYDERSIQEGDLD